MTLGVVLQVFHIEGRNEGKENILVAMAIFLQETEGARVHLLHPSDRPSLKF